MNLRILSILVTFIILSQFSFAQKIEPGKYVSVWKYNHFTGETVYNGEYGEEITFLDSVKFIYRYRDDITDRRGTGSYKKGNKFLNLEFDGNSASFDTTNYNIINSEISLSDSIILNIDIRDKFSELRGARIGFFKSGLEILHSSSDKDGTAIIKIPKTILPVLIRISYVGYDHIFIKLDSAINAKIIATMDMPYRIITEKKSITYSIKDIDLDGFYAKGGLFSDWTFFKKEE